ncbi:DUF3016 domain-containing protein [Paracoccus denitrificans]|uniref:DUF3016 domain-containing protein n=1 Tax=Paracoccus denitrificans TaxID=266 RepID=UPI001F306B9F|nr:DUF3016 domain-containing protein [Paracoccus denitrificans]
MLRALLLSTSLALPVLFSAPETAAADVAVTYIAPEKFRDREFRQERTRASALVEFDREFTKLAARYLPAGQDLPMIWTLAKPASQVSCSLSWVPQVLHQRGNPRGKVCTQSEQNARSYNIVIKI